MEFPQTVWLNVYVRSGSPRLFKVPGGILDLNPTTGCDLLLLLGQTEDVGIGNVAIRRLFGLFVGKAFLRRGNGAPENVGILGGNLLEIWDGETEILSDDLDWGVDEPVGEHESCPGSIEISVREDQEEFEAIIQCLDTMGKVLGESSGNLVTVSK